MGKADWWSWNRWNVQTHTPIHICVDTVGWDSDTTNVASCSDWLTPLYPQPLLPTSCPSLAFVKTWLLPEDIPAYVALSGGNCIFRFVFPNASGPAGGSLIVLLDSLATSRPFLSLFSKVIPPLRLMHENIPRSSQTLTCIAANAGLVTPPHWLKT